MGLGCQTLSDFRYYVQDEGELQASILDKCGEPLKSDRIQLARLRHAWAACVQFEKSREQQQSLPQTESDDTLLPQSDLQALKLSFFQRYHLKYPPELTPSDRLISKLARQLRRRSLEVQDLSKVHSLAYQRTHPAKKQRLATSSSVEVLLQDPGELDAMPVDTAETYLEQLSLYVTALAIAGSQPATGAPSAPETVDVDSWRYVVVPMDVVLKYLWRARQYVGRLPAGLRLRSLTYLDSTERGEWSSRFNTGAKSLGELVANVYQERDAHWSAPAERPAEPASAPPSPKRKAAAVTEPPSGTAYASARTLKDGTALCEAWNKGRCQSGKKCSNGQHRCNRLLQSGRVCGSHKHTGPNCDTRGRL